MRYLLRECVIEFYKRASDQPKPFILFFTSNAPHDPFTPANEDLELYLDIPPHRPPNFNEEDVSDKPIWVQDKLVMSEQDLAYTDSVRLAQPQTLASLDRSIA